ncbi:iron ABC transporter permease [Domibacillus indicus]|uniref:FecCD family ABC transporter permease n=1 Tax=Domibacillus indicus TaxID=1437523 RepID=UPI002041ED9C|nr:iron ABC transporter permease [Domibacillus indicus]MCM3790136.1 iron ABC transporter permease [Domibacillus indicus]
MKTRQKKAGTAALVLLLLCLCVMLISLNTGTIRLSPVEVFKTALGFGSPRDSIVLFDYRLPRLLIAMLAGIGLGIAGCLLQGLSRNALADPGVIGIHAGAAFGLILFLRFFGTLEGSFTIFIPLFTFIGGLCAAGLITVFSFDRKAGFLPQRLLLNGIALAAGFSALTLVLSLRLDEEVYSFAAYWLAGNIWGREWIHVLALLPWLLVLVPYSFFHAGTLNMLSLGEAPAAGLGVNVAKQRAGMLLCAVALSSASVSMAGGIGFIGLAAPQIARRIAGPLHQYVLPLSGLIGMLILMAADTIGRSLFAPAGIPAGIVTAALGAPYFLYVFRKSTHS